MELLPQNVHNKPLLWLHLGKYKGLKKPCEMTSNYKVFEVASIGF